MSKTDTPSFGAILDKPSVEVERPKPLPAGTYLCVVAGMPRYDKSSKKGTEFAEFTCKVLQAGEDVDQDALEEMGGIADKVIKNTYYITPDALFMLKEFLINCGIEEGEKTLRQMIDEVPGCQVLITVKHRAGDNGRVFMEVAGTASAA